MILKYSEYFKVSTDYILEVTDDPTPAKKQRYIKNQYNNLKITNVKNNKGTIKL